MRYAQISLSILGLLVLILGFIRGKRSWAAYTSSVSSIKETYPSNMEAFEFVRQGLSVERDRAVRDWHVVKLLGGLITAVSTISLIAALTRK